MKKISMIAVLTTVLALSGSGLSYATTTQKVPTSAADTGQVTLTPELVTQAIAELKAAGIPHETSNDAKGVKTTFHFKQGLSFALVEPRPAIAAFLWGGWDGRGPYVLFNKYDVDAIFNGSAYALTVGICLLPGVGWAACTAVGAITTAVTQIVNANTGIVCHNSQMKIYVSGRFGGCV